MTAPTLAEPARTENLLAPSPPQLLASPEQIVARIKQARELVIAIQKEVMKPGVHYGIIPGTDKPVLLKDGADVLNMAFQITPREEEVLDLSGADERRFKVSIGLYDGRDRRRGFGVGICSTNEDKYRWRKAYRSEWDTTAAERRRAKEKKSRDAGGGTYIAYEVRTEPADLENTVLQMAVKRALVQATRQVHAVSDIFADITIDDLPEEVRESLNLGGGRKVGAPKAARPAAAGTQKAAPPPPAGTTPASPGAPNGSASAPAPAREPGSDDEPPADRLIPADRWEPVKAKLHAKGVTSTAQVKRLLAIGMQSGYSAAEIRAEVQAGLGLPLEEIPFGNPYDLVVALFSTARPTP